MLNQLWKEWQCQVESSQYGIQWNWRMTGGCITES